LQDLPGAVGGTVVDGDYFMRDAAEFQLEMKMLDGGRDATFLVAGRNDDGQQLEWRVAGHGWRVGYEGWPLTAESAVFSVQFSARGNSCGACGRRESINDEGKMMNRGAGSAELGAVRRVTEKLKCRNAEKLKVEKRKC